MSKIKLIVARPQDAEELTIALQKVNLDNFSFFEQAVTVDRERKYIERVAREGNYLYLARNQDEKLVGTVGLHETDCFNHTARIGVTIFDQNQGYGKAAMRLLLEKSFKELGLEKLYANVIATNTTQIAWDKKFGFTEEGLLKGEYLLNGKRHDMVRLGLEKSDWELLTNLSFI